VPNATLRVLHRQAHACLIAPDVDLADIMKEDPGEHEALVQPGISPTREQREADERRHMLEEPAHVSMVEAGGGRARSNLEDIASGDRVAVRANANKDVEHAPFSGPQHEPGDSRLQGAGRLIQPFDRGIGLRERFDTLLTWDDVTRGKPSPDLYLLAASRLRVKPELCVAVEDSNHGVTAAHKRPEELVRVPCRGAHEMTIHQPINSYHWHVFGYSKGKGLKRIRNARVHGELQARGGAHQTQGGCGGSGDGCSNGSWLMQWADMLGGCPRDKPLTHGRALGTGTLASQATDGHRGEPGAASERFGVEGAVEVSEEGAQN